MHFYDHHRIQTIFVLLQAGMIVGGSMLIGGSLKIFGYEDNLAHLWPGYVLFLRNWGFVLIVIPAAWTMATITLEQRTDWFSKCWTICTGLLTMFGLALLLYSALMSACFQVTMSMSDQ